MRTFIIIRVFTTINSNTTINTQTNTLTNIKTINIKIHTILNNLIITRDKTNTIQNSKAITISRTITTSRAINKITPIKVISKNLIANTANNKIQIKNQKNQNTSKKQPQKYNRRFNHQKFIMWVQMLQILQKQNHKKNNCPRMFPKQNPILDNKAKLATTSLAKKLMSNGIIFLKKSAEWTGTIPSRKVM